MATLDSWLNRKKGKPPDVAGKPPNAVATLSVQDDSYTGTNVTPEQAEGPFFWGPIITPDGIPLASTGQQQQQT